MSWPSKISRDPLYPRNNKTKGEGTDLSRSGNDQEIIQHNRSEKILKSSLQKFKLHQLVSLFPPEVLSPLPQAWPLSFPLSSLTRFCCLKPTLLYLPMLTPSFPTPHCSHLNLQRLATSTSQTSPSTQLLKKYT